MALQADNIADLITSTLKELGRLKVTDLSSDLQSHVAMNQLLNAKKVTFRGGIGIQWNVRVARGNSAKHVGLYNQDTVNVTDGLQTANIPWRHSTFNFAYDRRVIKMNASDPEQVVDYLQERRIQELSGFIELMEETFWSKPADSNDDVTPFGLLYWIVKNATEGFNGGDPAGFALGCGGLSSATYARWRNWTAQYANVTKDDLVRKMRKAAVHTKFTAPAPQARGKDYNTGDDMAYYTNYDVIGPMEEALEQQNDNLGNDVASKDGQLMFRQRPVVFVPYLAADATDPVYGVNWGVFKPVVLKGEWMREEPAEKAPNQHSVYVVHTDTSHNTRCTDRRRNFVISK